MRFRPTPAGVVACLALAIALAGSAFAASALVPKDSVGSRQVINGSLQTKDLSGKARAAGAVGGKRRTRAERAAHASQISGVTGVPLGALH